MAKSPKSQPRNPATHSKKDPARPTRAKASRPDSSPMEPSLAELLNPAIGQGTAGVGAQTGLEPNPEPSGLKPPPDNSFDRRADFSAAHRARKSTKGFDEAPQSDYVGKTPHEPVTINTKLAEALGYRMPGDEDVDADTAPSGVTATAQALEQLLRKAARSSTTRPGRSGSRTGRRARRNPKAASGSSSSPTSSPRATSRSRSRNWSRA